MTFNSCPETRSPEPRLSGAAEAVVSTRNETSEIPRRFRLNAGRTSRRRRRRHQGARREPRPRTLFSIHFSIKDIRDVSLLYNTATNDLGPGGTDIAVPGADSLTERRLPIVPGLTQPSPISVGRVLFVSVENGKDNRGRWRFVVGGKAARQPRHYKHDIRGETLASIKEAFTTEMNRWSSERLSVREMRLILEANGSFFCVDCFSSSYLPPTQFCVASGSTEQHCTLRSHPHK